MRKGIAVFLCLIVIFSLTAGCGEKAPEYELGKEFLLPIGEEASIKGEDLKIEFTEVLEDSRCPKNVECVWAGQARYVIFISKGESSERLEITEPGAEGQVTYNLQDYEIHTKLEPYPEAPDSIAPGDYKLRMSVKGI